MEKGKAGDSALVACVVFQTRDAQGLVEILRQALTGVVEQVEPLSPPSAVVPFQKEPEDPWLKHPQAAEYLGISRSTLYQYACQKKIECRKLGGRLKYRVRL